VMDRHGRRAVVVVVVVAAAVVQVVGVGHDAVDVVLLFGAVLVERFRVGVEGVGKKA
jgi:hypothetical protein